MGQIGEGGYPRGNAQRCGGNRLAQGYNPANWQLRHAINYPL